MKKKTNKNLFYKINAFFQKYSLNKLKVLLYYVDSIILLFVSKPKKQNNLNKKVAIIFNLALGDGLVFRNLLIKYLKINESYNVTLYCQKGLKQIYKDIKNLNIIELDFNNSTINIKQRIKTIKKIREQYYNILYDPIGANEYYTNVLMSRCFVADEKKGCIINDISTITNKKKINKIYTSLVNIYSHSLICQYNEFLTPNTEIKYEKLLGVKPNISLPKEYYIVFSSASTNLKKWPIERYAEIVKKIYSKTKLPLLICGTKNDKEDYNKLISLIKGIPYENIIGRTNLLEFVYVINKSKFVITNDTSTYHIAVINQVPVTIVTGGYTFDRYIKYEFNGNEKYKKPYICAKNMKCFNCNNKCCKLNVNDSIWPCLNTISINNAWLVIKKMIYDEVNK